MQTNSFSYSNYRMNFGKKLRVFSKNGKTGESQRRKATGVKARSATPASCRRKDGSFIFLRCSIGPGKLKGGVFLKNAAANPVKMKAFYCKFGNDKLGVYPSVEGPKLCFNQDVYPLNESCWDMELLIGKDTNAFNFYWKGEIKISFKAPANPDFFLKLYRYLL